MGRPRREWLTKEEPSSESQGVHQDGVSVSSVESIQTDRSTCTDASTDKLTKLLSPVRKLNEDRDNWSLATLCIADDKNASLTTLVAAEPGMLYNYTKTDVEELITKLVDHNPEDPLQAKAANDLNVAVGASRDWKSNRKSTGPRKAGAFLQTALSCIGEFLKGFSGIAEIVKAADQQFGGLAYGTFALLVAAAVHKQAREEALEDALEQLAYAFPRLEILERVRKTDSLQLLIVEVFELVILFCREVIEYFARKLRRLAKAFSPLKLKTLSRLRAKLSEIQKECAFVALEELADTRRQLREVQQQLRRMEETGDDTNSRMRESQAWAKRSNNHATEAYITDLKKRLGLGRFEDASSQMVSRYKTLLANEFSNHRKKHTIARQLTPELLEQAPVFSKWKERNDSTVLVLGGKNWLDDTSVQLNWLSYASVYVVESTRKPTHLLSWFCQTGYTASRRKRRSFSEILRHFIYQLVEQCPEYVQPQLEEVSEAMDSADWNSKDCSIAFDAMTEYFASLLKTLEQDTEIVMVIDRLDQCRWSDDTNDQRSRLIEAIGSLRDLASHSDLKHLRIKVLLVIDHAPGRDVVETLGFYKNEGLDWNIDWDQEADD